MRAYRDSFPKRRISTLTTRHVPLTHTHPPNPPPSPFSPTPAVRNCETLEEQIAIYKPYEKRLDSLSNFVNLTRRFWCPFLGVPASQVDLFDGNIVKHVLDNLFYNTHIAKDNYFYYAYCFATYTRENCPRYLQPQYFKTLKANVSRIDIRTMTLKDAAACYPDGYFSRYILLDHMDWMPASIICDEWSVFVKKARSDCRVLWRSFASFQHIGPLKYLDFHAENVRAAHKMYPDRVSMYNSTHLATIPANFNVVPRTEYKPRGTCCDDVRVLYSNFVKGMHGNSHQDKLESFYRSQAGAYDVYRHRFLHGRVPMMDVIPTPKGGVWLDMGGGTASNLELIKTGLDTFSRIVVLDLCRPLLDVARQRVEVNGWDNVELVCGDATADDVKGLPKAGTVDLITFSYSLTMIPDWRAALKNVSSVCVCVCGGGGDGGVCSLDVPAAPLHPRTSADFLTSSLPHPSPSLQAYRLLAPGGYIAVSDFTVTEDHGCIDRRMWPYILGQDGVRPTPEHIPTLQALFREVHIGLGKGGFPYVPLLEAPYYHFVGQKVL